MVGILSPKLAINYLKRFLSQELKLKMKQSGIRNKDLVIKKYGSKGHISSLLNKRKPLTLDLAKRFHKEFGIPADVLLA